MVAPSLYWATLGSVQSVLSTLALFLFAAAFFVALSNHRRDERSSRMRRILLIHWFAHGLIYYAVALVLRMNGYRVGDQPVTTFMTLWSSAVRLQILISLGVAEVMLRWYRRDV